MASLGQSAGISSVSKEVIELLFPGLIDSGFSIMSPETPEYNCLAWTAGDTEAWWEPDAFNLGYWPSNAPREFSIDAYIKAYETLGYTCCENAEYEEGFEKIVLFVNSYGKLTHAARQLNSGKWTSKLGQLEDIEHSLEGLVGSQYGSVSIYMKRAGFR